MSQPLVINGWNIFAHTLFLDQFEELLTQVECLRQKNPEDYKSKSATKRLAAIAKLAFEIIPQDPTRSEYRQGTTLGDEYKHWLRAKFFSSTDCSSDTTRQAKLLSLLGLTMRTPSEHMVVVQMLIEFSRKCSKVITPRQLGEPIKRGKRRN